MHPRTRGLNDRDASKEVPGLVDTCLSDGWWQGMARIAQGAFPEGLSLAVHGKDVQDRDGTRNFDRDGRAAKSLNAIAIESILRC
jgi:hypothetical protein